jgi:glycosyltransferase involved in cell wall biosynthesis
MRILVVVSNYPRPGRRFSGVFNQRSVEALKEHCECVTVLSPRPYVPPLLTWILPVDRWKEYASAGIYEIYNGVPVHRPAYLQFPRLVSIFSQERGVPFFCMRTARKLHARYGFDAILSFELASAGGLAWRLAEDLDLPAVGWATGSDVRFPVHSSQGRNVARTLERLDLVFYQSHELLEKAAGLLHRLPSQSLPDRHAVLSRGIPMPPLLPRDQIRKRVRAEWGITDEQVLVLSISRIFRDKGIFDLLEAVQLAAARDSRVTCVVVGASPAYDESASVQKQLDKVPGIRKTINLLPACHPDMVWEYLCAADIFAFTSHQEGMPNSLLEAMAMGVPAVAFAIPPVLELEAGTGAVWLVPPFDPSSFSDALLRLTASPPERTRIGHIGRRQVLDRFLAEKNMTLAIERLAHVVQKRRLSRDRRLKPIQPLISRAPDG